MNDTEKLADRGLTGQPIYLSDLDQCQPDGALLREPRRGSWQLLDYETDMLSGVMLLARPETAAPEITYPLGVSGWHAVSIGVYQMSSEDTPLEVLVKTSGDQTFSILKLRPVERRGRWGGQLRELFWRIVDLTGQELVLGQVALPVAEGEGPGSHLCSPCGITYIKLVALSDAEVRDVQAERKRTDTMRLFAHDDAHGPHFSYRPTTAEEIRRHIEPYRDTDFSRLYWETGSGDALFYFSKIGRIPTYDSRGDYGRLGDRMICESWQILRDKGIDPFQVALDHTHEIGLEFHAAYRLAGWTYPPPLGYYSWTGSFFDNHPEWHCVDREGRDVPRMSYAFREVQDFVLSILRETAGYPIEGICLLYNRRPPYLEYEQPLVDGFKAAHGRDPHLLPEDDPTWLTYRAGVMTEFMRRVRGEMDTVSQEQGRQRPIEVSVCVLGKEEDNMFFALDIPAWVREGLVDTIIPYSPAPLALPVWERGRDTDTWSNPEQVKPFVDATRGTRCTLAPNVLPRQMSPEDFRRMASMLYGTGADHLFFWDSDVPNRADYTEGWSALRRLGHREEIEAWKEAGEPSLTTPTMELRKLGHWDVSYAPPG